MANDPTARWGTSPRDLRSEDRGDRWMSRETNTAVGTKMGAAPTSHKTRIMTGSVFGELTTAPSF